MSPLSTYGATTTESLVKTGGASFSTLTRTAESGHRIARATPRRRQSLSMRLQTWTDQLQPMAKPSSM
eukprot:12381827-Heterocapsa_arctica.AAC.1